MALPVEKQKEILEAILGKMKDRNIGKCPLCGTLNWQLVDSFSSVGLSDDLNQIIIGGPRLPSVVIVCRTCGNTHLLNLRVLKLDHLLPQSPESPNEPEK